jgi:hypothetical protein
MRLSYTAGMAILEDADLQLQGELHADANRN